MQEGYDPYWVRVSRKFYQQRLGAFALWVIVFFCLAGIYAPFLASSKPIIVQFQGDWYFPLFRYLFYGGFFTKDLDIFFNVLMFTLPFFVCVCFVFKKRPKVLFRWLIAVSLLQCLIFLSLIYSPVQDPAFDAALSRKRQEALAEMASYPLPPFAFDLKFMSPYAKLNAVLKEQQRARQQQRFERYSSHFPKGEMPTLWQEEQNNEAKEIARLKTLLAQSGSTKARQNTQASIQYILGRRAWLNLEMPKLKHEIMPLVRPFHWEEDAGGSQSLNQFLPIWELTRTNRKDLVSALIFGVRISIVVGILSVALGLAIGLPIGAIAGYYGGNFDIFVSRMLEVWEAMPTFFMLLMVVAMTQSKSIFLIIAVIGIFGWTGFSRYLRGEFFKQRHLPYIEACRAQGFNDSKIIFSHIFPNAIPPVLTLLPFVIMGAITSEAGLSFLGLGEEGSCSWGGLMDEGRLAFPGESYLLWPPAILLTILLVAIAIVGDTFRDALDPRQ